MSLCNGSAAASQIGGPGSNAVTDTGYPHWRLTWHLSVAPVKWYRYLKMKHDRFLPEKFRLSSQSSYFWLYTTQACTVEKVMLNKSEMMNKYDLFMHKLQHVLKICICALSRSVHEFICNYTWRINTCPSTHISWRLRANFGTAREHTTGSVR